MLINYEKEKEKVKKISVRAYIKHLDILVPVVSINFIAEEVEVDLTNGNGDTFFYHFDEVILTQSSCLTDSIGKEIYDGDILEVITLDSNEKFYFEVKYGEFVDVNADLNDKTLGWHLKGRDMVFTILQEYEGELQVAKTKVVGNIFQNKDLLKSDKTE